MPYIIAKKFTKERNVMERWLQSVYSDGTDNFLSPSNPKFGQYITVKIRVLENNPIKKIFLRTIPNGEAKYEEMKYTLKGNFQVYFIKIKLDTYKLNYRFKIVCDRKIYWLNAYGVCSYSPTDDMDFKIIANFKSPFWINTSVFYQIFPDTFYKSGNIDFSCKNYKYMNRKPKLLKWTEEPREFSKSFNMDFYGGNLKGISDKIAYLKELGVNAIYLNPIFQAPSNHRYDIQDYFKIDPLLGTNKDFLALVKKLHKNKIRIILDGVFNHCGVACRWFNKNKFYEENGAFQDMKSPFSEFYTFSKHPTKYYCWNKVKTLPKFNYKSKKLRNIIYKDENSVLKFWIKKYNIDGWRLDVANMLARQDGYQENRSVLSEMRTELKSINEDAYFLGEHFFDASNILQGDCLDATMNYLGFTLPVRKWLSLKENQEEIDEITTEDFAQQLALVRSKISWQIALIQFNLINCHDLPRLSYIIDDARKNMLSIILLMTYIGVPSIYYGDEIALNGELSSESSRRPMEWDHKKWNTKIQKLYQELILLRKSNKALVKGGIKVLYSKDNIFCYARFYKNDIVIVIVNRCKKQNITLDLGIIGLNEEDKLEHFFSKENIYLEKEGFLPITIPECSGIILIKKEK